jgi:hypothetical protein
MAHAKEDLDAEIRRYETMPIEEVNAELARLGIDPQPTIDAVKKLVEAKLKEWDKPRRRKPRPV